MPIFAAVASLEVIECIAAPDAARCQSTFHGIVPGAMIAFAGASKCRPLTAGRTAGDPASDATTMDTRADGAGGMASSPTEGRAIRDVFPPSDDDKHGVKYQVPPGEEDPAAGLTARRGRQPG